MSLPQAIRLRLSSSSSRWVTPLIAFGVGYIALFQLQVGFPTWEGMSYVATFSFLIVGPLSVLAGFIAGSLESRDGWQDLVRPTIRWPNRGALAAPLSSLLWCVGAYLLGIGFSAALSARSVIGLSSIAPHIAAGSAAVAAAVLGAYVLGSEVKVLWLAPIAAMATYAILGFSAFGDGVLARLTPIPDGEPSPFFPYSPQVSLVRTSLFLGISILSITVVAWRSGKPKRSIGIWAAISLIAVAASLFWLVDTRLNIPQQTAVVGQVPLECKNLATDTQVCVHAAYSRLLLTVASVAVALDPYLRPVYDGRLRLQHDERRAGEVAISSGETIVMYSLSLSGRNLDADTTGANIARTLLAGSSCEFPDVDWYSAVLVYSAGYAPAPWIPPSGTNELQEASQRVIRAASGSWQSCQDVRSAIDS